MLLLKRYLHLYIIKGKISAIYCYLEKGWKIYYDPIFIRRTCLCISRKKSEGIGRSYLWGAGLPRAPTSTVTYLWNVWLFYKSKVLFSISTKAVEIKNCNSCCPLGASAPGRHDDRWVWLYGCLLPQMRGLLINTDWKDLRFLFFEPCECITCLKIK